MTKGITRLRGGAAVAPENRTARGDDGLYEARWSTATALRIGYLAGMGRTSADIGRELDLVGPSISAQLRKHGIVDRSKLSVIPIELPNYDLGRLSTLARARGLAPEEWLRKIIAAAVRDDLFSAIVGD